MRGILVLDFGSQFTQLIARRLREIGHYSEIHPYHLSLEQIRLKQPYGIILSGGPNSVYEEGAPQCEVVELRKIAPVMGVCYGMQLMAHRLGGVVNRASHKEYGSQIVQWEKEIRQIGKQQSVWMSHGDVVEKVPPGFRCLARSETQHIASIEGDGYFAVQFHPEVAHSEKGQEILKYFIQDICQAPADWKPEEMLRSLRSTIQEKVSPADHVLVGLSGGVDSSVVAKLLTNTLGKERVHCIFVNNGLLRKNEYSEVLNLYNDFGLNVRGVDASDDFLQALAGVADPEAKRKAIGRIFIDVFEKNIPHDLDIRWLAQGTLYPDVIESVSSIGGSVTIKSHHNVGGLPEKMKLQLLEPVRELFKDEVRALGLELGLPKEMLWRHPFPGPGLAVRVLGEVTAEKLNILREVDAIYIEELRRNDLYHKIWQAFAVLLPVKSVGVQGDSRTYSYAVALRAVTSQDGMTADWFEFSPSFLKKVSNQITNKVQGVNRVTYDITSKPPGTIEWE